LTHAKVRHLAVPCELVDWKIAMTIKPSIAVVDDDESVREATTRLLRSLGFIAKEFSSPDEFCRQIAKTSRPA
jgi:FixJ family two-component response regulator